MEKEEKLGILKAAYAESLRTGKAKNQKEFGALYGISPSALSAAMNGDEKYLTDSIIARVISDVPAEKQSAISIPVLPVQAMAGTLVEFFQQVSDYDCERMISPIKGVDYAIKIYGDSMSPEYPSGSLCLIKRIDEKQFIAWNEVYVLDTDNGVIIKKIRRTDREDVVECVSINPAYQPFTIDTTYVHGWYRVLMVLSIK